MTAPWVTVENLTVRYGHQVALAAISGIFHQGSLTAVAGPNGAGKSTLLKAISGTVKPSEGRVILAEGARNMAYLPQASAVQRDFPLSVAQAVSAGLWREAGEFRPFDKGMKARVVAALEEAGIADLAARQIGALSGGQFQRMLFARLIVQNADLILLDEPFAAIDFETTARLMQIVLNWHRQGRTIICVLHDLLLIQKYFPDSFVLAGKCMGHGHTHKLLEQKLFSCDLDMAEICPGPDTEAHHHHDHDPV